jgi:geranylgeranyl pyrophosphate synthase
MGFQIVDDVLDFQGDEAVLGKPVAGDLREGIVTLPALYYLCDHPEDDRVSAVVCGRETDDRRVREVVASIRASGATEKAMVRAREFIARSQAALSVLPDSQPRAILHALAEYSVAREH